MQLRHVLLALGLLALVAGIGLSIVSLRTPRQLVATTQQAVQPVTVLVATRALPVATLLRGDDTKWSQVPAREAPPGAIIQGKEPAVNVLGAATSRAFKEGDAITQDAIIQPTDARFLPAVLAPGMRALALSFSEPQLGAGLIQPGDHVDVILTQNFTSESHNNLALREVGETILRNLRVIATDRTHLQQPTAPNQHVTAQQNRPVPRTVTLEVTTGQAEDLTVAQRLGALQLTLRGLGDQADTKGALPPPTWATDVSRALRYVAEGGTNPAEASRSAAAASGASGAMASPMSNAPVAIDIFRGTKSERRCYSEQIGSTVPCQPGSAAPGAGTAEPEAGAAVPGKSSALALTPTKRAA